MRLFRYETKSKKEKFVFSSIIVVIKYEDTGKANILKKGLIY